MDHSSRAAPEALDALARRLLALPPSCGPVRLIGVDGHAGSGKSTFAARLSQALGEAPVLHLDDLATHDELFEWTGRFREQVLTPLAAGRTARYGVYDWVHRAFTHREELAPAPFVIVEGVGAGRRSVRPFLACLLWMEVPERRSWQRGRRRDGPGLSGFWDEWIRAEERHFAADPSRPFADHLVLPGNEGYVVLTGPPATA
ncbi:uridine kinase family protein [Streptomyces sp. KR80]|uniref:uridine kinase family protein n=1 Tax=Streptomyces sp. KR80 TaxID=3457426 RepID=UPI003FD42F99